MRPTGRVGGEGTERGQCFSCSSRDEDDENGVSETEKVTEVTQCHASKVKPRCGVPQSDDTQQCQQLLTGSAVIVSEG